MSKISEASIDSNGKFYFNGYFKTIVGSLCAIILGMWAWGFNYLNAENQQGKVKDEKQDEKIVKLEISMGKIDGLADDMKEIKRLLRRSVPNNAPNRNDGEGI